MRARSPRGRRPGGRFSRKPGGPRRRQDSDKAPRADKSRAPTKRGKPARAKTPHAKTQPPSWDTPVRVRPHSARTNLAAQPWEALRPLLPDDGQADRRIAELQRYCALVVEWNRGASNLISHRDENRIVERHVRESLAPARWLAALEARRWLDLGSGAGFPALPLAIWGLGAEWNLVESRRPKALFLRKVARELGLEDRIRVHHSRLEDLLGEIRPVEALTSRATYRIGPTLDLARQFLVPGGSAVLWKGSSWEAELAGVQRWEEQWTIERRDGLGPGLGEIVYLKLR